MTTHLEGFRIHEIRIRDYRGIEQLDVKVPPAGVLVTGECRTGKTSVLRAVLAALTAQDVGPDAIRHGADHAEVFVDLDALSVKRTLDTEGSTLSASSAIPHSKQRAKIGQKRLDELFGPRISPMALFRAKAEERRKIIMAAMPLKLEERHLDEWLTPEQRTALPPEFWQTLPHMHGLEAVAAVHKALYDVRARANADTKGQRGRVEHLTTEAATFAGVPDLAPEEVERRRVARAEAQREADALIVRSRTAAAFAEQASVARGKLGAKRSAAARALELVERVDLAPLKEARVLARDALATLRTALASAELAADSASRDHDEAMRANERADELERSARRDMAEADELEATLATAGAPAPTVEENERAAQAIVHAEAAWGEAAKVAEARAARERIAKEAAELARLEALATGLTATVDHLRLEAPAQLLRESEGIPGLGLEDGELTVDGVRLDALSGAEQLRVCIEVAKRASRQRGGEGRVLITDGLEALDPKTLARFLRLATADGWQLLATRVTEGELTVQAIEVEDAKEAAE
jgi:hypothetical protein